MGPILSNERREITPVEQPGYYAVPTAADEISLIDLLLILVRRRWWFVGTFAGVMVAVIAFLLLVRPLYESRATIQIGQVASMNGSGKPVPLESPDALVSRLRAEYHLSNADTGPIEPPKVTEVSSANNASGLVTIRARGYSPKQVHGFLQKTVQQILDSQQKRFAQAMRGRKSYLTSLEQQQKQLHYQASAISKKLASDPGNNAASTLTTEQATLLQQISIDQTTIANVRQSMTPPQSMPTQLLRQPTLPVEKASPRTLLTLVLGVVGGCLAALFVAFGAEFFSQARAEMRRRFGS